MNRALAVGQTVVPIRDKVVCDCDPMTMTLADVTEGWGLDPEWYGPRAVIVYVKCPNHPKQSYGVVLPKRS